MTKHLICLQNHSIFNDKNIEEKLHKSYFWSDVARIAEEIDLISALESFRFLMTSFIPPMSQNRIALSIWREKKIIEKNSHY